MLKNLRNALWFHFGYAITHKDDNRVVFQAGLTLHSGRQPECLQNCWPERFASMPTVAVIAAMIALVVAMLPVTYPVKVVCGTYFTCVCLWFCVLWWRAAH